MHSGAISTKGLQQLRRMARRRASSAEEADDLVQDALLAALEQGRRCEGPQFFGWASAVLKRRAMFVARTAGRRRRRDANYATQAGGGSSYTSERRLPRTFIDTLPPSIQTIAFLVNVGLGRAEIESVLGISELALRQRISCLRKAWKASGADPELLESLDRPPRCGLQRRALKNTLVKLPAARSGVADPDGHKIFLSAAHVSSDRGN